jgi:hypothetical protein
MTCSLCYTVRTWTEYKIITGGVHDGVLSQYFGPDLAGANTTLYSYLEHINVPFVCFYNPANLNQIVTDINYIILVCFTAYCLGHMKHWHYYVFTIWYILVPFILFISLWGVYHLPGCLGAAIVVITSGPPFMVFYYTMFERVLPPEVDDVQVAEQVEYVQGAYVETATVVEEPKQVTLT